MVLIFGFGTWIGTTLTKPDALQEKIALLEKQIGELSIKIEKYQTTVQEKDDIIKEAHIASQEYDRQLVVSQASKVG